MHDRDQTTLALSEAQFLPRTKQEYFLAMQPVKQLTVAECLLWWTPPVLTRIFAWSKAVIAELPADLRQELGDSQPDTVQVALGTLLLLHDEYNVRPEYRLLPDAMVLLFQTTAKATLFCAHAEPEMHLPMTAFLCALDEARRGFTSVLPSNSANDAGDRVSIPVLIPCDDAS